MPPRAPRSFALYKARSFRFMVMLGTDLKYTLDNRKTPDFSGVLVYSISVPSGLYSLVFIWFPSESYSKIT